MKPDELKLLMEELNREHEQLITEMRAYAQTMEYVRNGLVPEAIVPDAIRAALDSVKLCRNQVEMTRQAILQKLS